MIENLPGRVASRSEKLITKASSVFWRVALFTWFCFPAEGRGCALKVDALKSLFLTGDLMQ